MSCTALITGGASGLGLAAATGILKKGVCLRVILVDRDEAAVKTAASELQKQFPRSQVEFASGDVTSESDMQKAVDLAASTESLPLRLVLNSAGVGYASRVILKDGTMPTASFSKVLEINLLGTFIVTKLAAETMTKKSPLISDGFGGETRGAIVNVASIAAFDGQIGQVPYAASKGAVVGMTLPLAREFARHHIRVNTIAPGVMATPLMISAPQKVVDSLIADIPHPHRFGAPEEFASLVCHLFENNYFNGETIRLDGALRMPPQARL